MESFDSYTETENMGGRKNRKLMAEKRRRARINQSLLDIKTIVCDVQLQNDPNFDKMEKAEILETTVDYLRNVRKINTTHQHVKEAVQARFQHGFSKCAEEILSYIQSLPGVSDNVHRQLRKHISRRMTQIRQVPVTSSIEDVTSYTSLCYERLNPVPVGNSHPAAHAYMGTSPVNEDKSFSDSGYAGSPDITKQSTHRVGHYHPSNLSDSELCKMESGRIHKNFDDSRVRAWLQSTWSFSQQIKTEQQAPWRPW